MQGPEADVRSGSVQDQRIAPALEAHVQATRERGGDTAVESYGVVLPVGVIADRQATRGGDGPTIAHREGVIGARVTHGDAAAQKFRASSIHSQRVANGSGVVTDGDAVVVPRNAHGTARKDGQAVVRAAPADGDRRVVRGQQRAVGEGDAVLIGVRRVAEDDGPGGCPLGACAIDGHRVVARLAAVANGPGRGVQGAGGADAEGVSVASVAEGESAAARPRGTGSADRDGRIAPAARSHAGAG